MPQLYSLHQLVRLESLDPIKRCLIENGTMLSVACNSTIRYLDLWSHTNIKLDWLAALIETRSNDICFGSAGVFDRHEKA